MNKNDTEYYKRLKEYKTDFETYERSLSTTREVMLALRNLQIRHTDDEVKRIDCVTCQKYVMMMSLGHYKRLKQEHSDKFKKKKVQSGE